MRYDISIIIPVYNDEKNIGKCIDSLLNQVGIRIQLIIVNDGSTDGTAAICEKYSTNKEGIVFITQENKGVSRAIMTGIMAAQAELVGFVDSDDFVDFDMYSTMVSQYKLMREPDITVVGYKQINTNNKIYRYGSSKKLYFSDDEVRKKLIPILLRAEISNNRIVSHSRWNMIYKRELISDVAKSLDSDIFLGEDFVMNFHALLRAKTVAVLGNYYPYNHVIREGSITTAPKNVLKIIDNYNKVQMNLLKISREFDYSNKLLDIKLEYFNYEVIKSILMIKKSNEEKENLINQLALNVKNFKLMCRYYMKRRVNLKNRCLMFLFGFLGFRISIKTIMFFNK